MFPLRDYQTEALDAIAAAATNGIRRPLAVAPTGSGKTVMFSHLISRRPGRALVLAHRDELISQAAGKIQQIAPNLHVGIVKAHRDDHNAPVVVASVQTLSRPQRLARIRRDFDTIIVDEAHHAVAQSYRTVLENLGSFEPDGPLTVGFTATAGRTDEVALGHVWEEIVWQRGILQMIADGHLVDIRAKVVNADIDLSHVKTRGGDFTDDSLGAELEASGAVAGCAAAYVEYAKDRRGIAFAPTVNTSLLLTAALCRAGIRAEHLDGTTPTETRRGILHRLHTGETQVVSNCAVLVEGFDEPSVACILNMRPTKSQVLFTQMVGRALRPDLRTGKQDALLLDLVGASEMGLATIADLAGLDLSALDDSESLAEAAAERAQQAASATGAAPVVRGLTSKDVSLFGRSKFRWMGTGDAYILPVGENALYLIPAGADDAYTVYRHPKGGKPVPEYTGLSLDYAHGVGEELARAEGGTLSKKKAGWRDKPSSAPQRSLLTRMGYGVDIPAQLSTGQAADLITVHIAGRTIRRLTQQQNRTGASV